MAMSSFSLRRRLAAFGLGSSLAVAGLLSPAGPAGAAPGDPTAVGVTSIQVLATNDFHGRIKANGAEAGAAVLAGAVEQLRAENPNTVFAAAGDLIGASTFESFIAHDKPTIDALNAAGLQVSAVGNHEFDQGYSDLVNRVMAPYDATANRYGGATWQYLGANVRDTATANPALPETWTIDLSGIKVGFVGVVTHHLPELVSPSGIVGLTVEPEVTAANRSAAALKAAGADIVVLLVHEGAASTAYDSAVDPASDFGTIVLGASPDVDAIVSGHTHLAYNHSVPVPAWAAAGRAVTSRPVVSAGQYGTNLNRLVFQVDTATKSLVGVDSSILALAGNYPADPAVTTIVAAAVAQSAVLGAQVLGTLQGPLFRAKMADGVTENRGGESTLGNAVAEVQRWATEGLGAQIAFMNPGGLRADLVGVDPTSYPTNVTFQQGAAVQPFANTLVTLMLTGAQLKAVLEQQWQPAGASRPFLKLGVSRGFEYTYDPTAAAGVRVLAMSLNGASVTPDATYTVTVNSFLASGGDNFGVFAQGTNKADSGRVDLTAMVEYLAATGTLAPDYAQRAVGVAGLAPGAKLTAGQQLSFNLTSLVMSAPADLRDSEVKVSLGHKVLGTFPVDATLGTAVSDEYGTASVTVTLPNGHTGDQVLTVTGATTGTKVSIPVTIAKAPKPKPHPAPWPKPHPSPDPSPHPTPGPTPGHGWWWGPGSWGPGVAWWTPPPAFWTHDGLAA
jgi:5'-nucleotidase